MISHHLPTGESISISFTTPMSIKLMHVQCNFDVYLHCALGYTRISTIEGVKAMTNINQTMKKNGRYTFLVSKQANENAMEAEVINEFKTYFINF